MPERMTKSALRKTVTAAVVAVALLGTGACTGHDEGSEQFHPSLRATQCPADIVDVMVGRFDCSFLTVHEGGSDPTRTIRLLVTRLQPDDGVDHDDPLIVVGDDFAAAPNYVGIAPAADRVGRTVIFLEPRGVGHSQPSLTCPEIDTLGPASFATGTTDPGLHRRFLTAVAACHDRLARTPLDLAAYNVPNAAADVVTLARTMGLKSWNAGSWGTSSRITLQLLQLEHPGLRAVFLDSPELPGDDPRLTAPGDTRAALQRLLRDCDRETVCHQPLPSTLNTVDAVLANLDRHPINRTLDTGPGAGDTFHFDGALTLRIIRYMLAQGASSGPELTPGNVPALIAALEHRQGVLLDEPIITPLVGDQPYCEGYLPKCEPHHRVTIGAYLSSLCHDLQPFTGPVPAGADARAASWSTVFAHNPYLDVCTSWPLTPARQPLPNRINSDVPTLILTGNYDPFISLTRLRTALTGLTHRYIVTAATLGHNVLGSPCMLTIRNTWIDNPGTPPNTTCVNNPDGSIFTKTL